MTEIRFFQGGDDGHGCSLETGARHSQGPILNYHKSTDVQRPFPNGYKLPWPSNGFILVSEFLPGIIPAPSKAVAYTKGVEMASKSLMHHCWCLFPVPQHRTFQLISTSPPIALV